jgi:lipid-binding SYLF domain-containing protein
MRRTQYVLFLTIAAAFTAAAADETAARLGKAANVFSAMTTSAHGIQAKIAQADCIAVIPGFKKGAIVVGFGGGRGFISCRNGGSWSAPGGVTVESQSVGLQVGGEDIDIVILSLDPARRAKLASSRFTIGEDASAAWGNGKSAHDDPNAKVVFYAETKGAFAGFDLDGLALKSDVSANKALYGKEMSNQEIVNGGAAIPSAASTLIAKLTQSANR